MKLSKPSRRLAGLVLAAAVLGLVAACLHRRHPVGGRTADDPHRDRYARPRCPHDTTVTATVTETPPTTTQPTVLVAATFKDPTTFECSDGSADSCWALDVTTTGPCPNGVYVAINVYKKDATEVLQVLETTSAPVTEPLGGTVAVQLGQTGLAPEGETLEADLKEARCP